MSRDPVQTRCLDSQQTFHPKFNDSTADVVLSSNQATLFRVSSVTLRTTSRLLGLFLSDDHPLKAKSSTIPPDMSGLSLDKNERDSTMDVISIPFEDTPIERVLLILCAQPVEPWKSFSDLEAAVDLMEYLDTPGPLSFVRASCFMPIFLAEPIRLYGLAARFGWDDVMQHAAELTLTLNLFPPAAEARGDASEIEDQLTRLPALALYKLLKMHRRRRDNFRERMYSLDTFAVGNALHINCPCGAEINNSVWRELRARLVWEMDQNPSGKTILALEMEEMDESSRCWKAKCSRCSSFYYNRLETSKNIRMCVERLPKVL